MKLFKYPIFFALILLMNCNSTQNTTTLSKNEFTIISKTKESWHSGAQEGYGGTNYAFKIIVNTDKTIQFDSIWAENKNAKFKVLKDEHLTSQDLVSKGDTISLKATILHTKESTLKATPPIMIEGDQAAISFLIDRKTKYKVIADFEIIKGPLRP